MKERIIAQSEYRGKSLRNGNNIIKNVTHNP